MKLRRKRREDYATPDLTPMIDVTFQLLIFFLLCTRFKQPERHNRADMPFNQGPFSQPEIPRETLTIYCRWDPQARTGDYVTALGARDRSAVMNTHASLEQLVIFPSDTVEVVREKRALYAQVRKHLIDDIERRLSGAAGIESLEISTAVDAVRGAAGGTAPWMFASLAIDAAAGINETRTKRGKPALPLKFKFSDALGRFGGR